MNTTSRMRRIAACLILTIAISVLPAQAGFLYVLNVESGGAANIHGFNADPTAGALTALSGFPVQAGSPGSSLLLSEAMAVDTERRRLYVLNDGPNTLSVYSIDPQTGALTQMPYSPLQLSNATWGTVNVHPSGSPVLVGGMVGTFAGIVGSFLVSDQSAQAAVGSPFSTGYSTPYSGAFSSDGAYFYTGGFTLNSPYITGFGVNAATGYLSPLPSAPFNAGGNRTTGFSTDNSGRLFVVDGGGNLRAYTTSTGNLSAVAGNPFAANAGAIDTLMHPGGEFIFVAGRIGDQVSAFRIMGDGSSTLPTGTSTVSSGGVFANILAMGSEGRHLYVSNGQSRSISTIGFDAATGALSFMNVQPDNTVGSAGTLVGMAFFNGPAIMNPPAPTAADMIQAMIDMMNGYDPPLPRGTLRSFVAKLENALKDLNSGNPDDARDKMHAFINHVSAQNGKALTAEQADELSAAAQAVIAVLETATTIPLTGEKQMAGKGK